MRGSVLDRLADKYEVDEETGCWVWTAGRTKKGYGQIKIDGRYKVAHRVAYELVVERVQEPLMLDHLCRNRACINPDHLEPVTCRENLLRGETLQAENAAKTHCPYGHEYTPENTYVDPRGSRRCRTCRAEDSRRRAA